jgi:two-component system sensor histidine kinase YesM
VFTKLLLAFLAVTVPLSIMSLVTTVEAERNAREEIAENIANQADYYLAQLESEIERIVDFQKEYLGDRNLLKLSTMPVVMDNYERIQSILAVERNILILKNVSRYIQSVDVLLKYLGRVKVISTDSSFDDAAPETVRVISNLNSLAAGPLLPSIDGLHLVTSYPVIRNGTPGNSFSYGVSITISRSEIRRQLEQIASHPGSIVLLESADKAWRVVGGAPPDEAVPADLGFATADGSRSPVPDVRSGRREYIVIERSSPSLRAGLFVLVPNSVVVGELRTYRVRFWIIFALAVAFSVFFSYWMHSLVARPLSRFSDAFARVETGDFRVQIAHERHDDFGILYRRFNEMVRRLRSLVEEIYEEKIHAQQAEMKQLQYQISPHFLYNSLFLLFRMAKVGDLDIVMTLADHLRKFYQYITRDGEEQATLEEEMAHARTYMSIQLLRFQGRIRADVDEIPDGYHDLHVPRLIIQPLIENAFEHGLRERAREGVLGLRLNALPGAVRITVDDNGTGVSPEDVERLRASLDNFQPGHSATTGLVNVHRRLQIRFGGTSGVDVGRSGLGGLAVTLTLQTRKMDDVPAVDS